MQTIFLTPRRHHAERVSSCLAVVVGAAALFLCCAASGEHLSTNVSARVDVGVSTNVVQWNNQEGCSTCEDIRKNNWALHHVCSIFTPYREATERGTITNILKTIRLSAAVDGERIEVTKTIVLGSYTNKNVLEWVPAP